MSDGGGKIFSTESARGEFAKLFGFAQGAIANVFGRTLALYLTAMFGDEIVFELLIVSVHAIKVFRQF